MLESKDIKHFAKFVRSIAKLNPIMNIHKVTRLKMIYKPQ